MVEHTYFLPAELYPVAPVGLQYEPGFTVTVAAPFGAVVSGAGAAVVAVLPAAGVVAAGAEDVADPYGASATPHLCAGYAIE